MDADKRIALFYEALRDEYKTYVDDMYKAHGFVLLAIGWVVTSDSARKALSKDPANEFAIITVAVLGACNLAISLGHYYRSKRLTKQILALDLSAAEIVKNYILTGPHIAVNAITVGGLFAVVIALLLSFRSATGG